MGRILLIFTIPLMTFGCMIPKLDAPGVKDITVDGLVRQYILYAPEGIEEEGPVPLLIAVHSNSVDAEEMVRFSGFNEIADRDRFIILYPNAIGGLWSLRIWSANSGIYIADDIAYIDAALDQVLEDHDIDANRIYAMGNSGGGLMSLQLACDLSDRIAAVVSIAGGTMFDALFSSCFPTAPVAVLLMHGTADTIAPFNGGDSFLGPFLNAPMRSVADSTRFWLANNGCVDAPITTFLPEIDPDDGTSVFVDEYLECSSKADVVVYTIVNGGHSWPGAPPFAESFFGATSQEISGTDVSLAFLFSHSREDFAL